MIACPLATRRCQPCEGSIPPLDPTSVAAQLAELPGWEIDGIGIGKTFVFANHYQALAFVNALAWISHSEDHHPDTRVSYREVRVLYSTHAIGGLSDNDLICAAKVEKLMNL
ncbi:4a-hydroxytetrahydrobiopterin dehydratase [Dechloromonas sp. ZY10]|uniref:4a-hydroxytetrahydrobiopterin dehydratase n=1 Tax=Dechloromonas aquae TaxID=2664436 RepID=UPI003527E782